MGSQILPELTAPGGGGTPHTLPPATRSILGGVIVGDGLDVSTTGTIVAQIPNTIARITESGTWTAPRAGTYRITCVGGGGGGGGGFRGQTYLHRGGAGGGGGVSVAYAALAAEDVLTIAIGAGGAAGGEQSDGASGGDTSVALDGVTLCAAGGGAGGIATAPHLPATGGAGDYLPGGDGAGGLSGLPPTTNTGQAAGGWPNGGPGGGYNATTQLAAGAGGAGWVIVEYWTPAI